MKRKSFFSIMLVALFLVLSSDIHSQMIADITSDIETEFGTYHPHQVIINPCTETYTVSSDLGNISNILNYYWDLSNEEMTFLKNNNFFLRPTAYKEIFDVYKNCNDDEIPIFVTTDAMLHTFHIIYDYALRALEVQRFAGDLDHLNKALLDAMKTLYYETDNDSLKAIVMKSVAYFGVATYLKDSTSTVPDFVNDLVNDELDLITSYEGFKSSPIFVGDSVDYIEDYSQYIPRGHYTRNDTLLTYFKSMMWYGRMTFRLEPDTMKAGKQKGREETLQAILLVKTLNQLNVNGEPAMTVWERIYDPTIFFVGKTDDLNIYDYLVLMEEVYGSDYLSLNISDFADDEKLDTFIVKAKKLHDPRINSNWVTDQEDFEDVTKGFRFMGQRFIPDSYMFQQLVYDKVDYYQGSGDPFTLVLTPNGPIRGFPRGLDIMTVLGSEKAEEIIRAEGDADYYGFNEQLEALKQEFANLTEPTWVQNLYWNWLYALMPLLEPKGEGYPVFMQKMAWTLKQLYTALASWGELRHDTILYAKQSYTSYNTGMPDPPGFTYGYVEPNPHLYARLASLANLMRTGLNHKGLLLSEFENKLVNFESLLLGLKSISEKELTNQELLSEEYNLIWTIGERLENLLTFSDDLTVSICDETDEGMAIVADVHTDSNSKRVLEEGVGYPFEVWVAVKIKTNIMLTKGAGFSYYEFKHPMADRLTDKAWQDMLISDNPPEIPQWAADFIDLSQDFTISGTNHAYLESETVNNITVCINPEVPKTGDTLHITVSSPIFYDSTLTAVFCNKNGDSFDTKDLGLLSNENNQYIYSGDISTKVWSFNGSVILNILRNQSYLISTHWFEIQHISSISENNTVPEKFRLYQNYPNPFNGLTTIEFYLTHETDIELMIYDLNGALIEVIESGKKAAGRYFKKWNAAYYPSGLYFLQLRVNNQLFTRKLILLK